MSSREAYGGIPEAEPLPGETSLRGLASRGGALGRSSAVLVLLCVLVALLVSSPVLIALVQAFQGGFAAVSQALSSPLTPTLLRNTLLVALIATPICGVFGVAGAWFVERTRLPGRWLWALLLVAPLTVPPFVTSYAWANLGVGLQGFLGAVGVIAFSYYPIVFLLAAVSLRGMDPALEESARALGLNARQTFFRVVLPQLRPALLGGLLLVALDALVEFDAFVALKFQTFSLAIYAQYQLGFSSSGAAALSLFSIVFCLVLLFGELRLRGSANYTRVSSGARRQAVRYELGRAKLPVLAGFAALALISVGLPVGMLVDWFSQSTSAALSMAAANTSYLLPATVTSVVLGVCTAALALALALPVAILVLRRTGPLATLIERATYLSYALPDLVAAIALSYFASRHLHFLYGTFVLLAVAEAILFVPFALVAIRSTLGQIEPALDDSARSLGSGPLTRLWRVTLPVARPGFVAAAVLVFAFVLGDLSTAQVLLPLNSYTLGTEFEANSSTVAFAAAAPFAGVLIVLAMGSAYVLMTRFGRVRLLGAE